MQLMKEMLTTKGTQLKTADTDEVQDHEAIERKHEKLEFEIQALRERIKQRDYQLMES